MEQHPLAIPYSPIQRRIALVGERLLGFSIQRDSVMALSRTLSRTQYAKLMVFRRKIVVISGVVPALIYGPLRKPMNQLFVYLNSL